MDKHQMEMLSVKSALERTIQALLASPIKGEQLYDDVCRFMAGMYVSKQINRDYTVDILTKYPQSIEVKFSTGSHITKVTYMLPPSMAMDGKRINAEKQKAIAEFIEREAKPPYNHTESLV